MPYKSALLLKWIPSLNPFVQVSFPSVICADHITMSVVVFTFSCYVSSKTHQLVLPARISCDLLYQSAAVSVSSTVTVHRTVLPS